MVIPRKFTLLGETVKVKLVVKVDKEGSWGEYNPNNNTIKILKSLNEEQKQSTFYHELIHCMTLTLGYPKLYHDEIYTDIMGKALYQILKTME